MLQVFRDNLKGTMAIIIVGLMIIPFALFGIDSLFLQDNSAGKAADVNGEIISEMALTRAIRVQKQQLLERFGDQAPADLLSDEQLRSPVLTRLLQRELLRQAAENGSMAISDAQLDQIIVATPQFQQDGRFSPELYTQLLRNMGYTPNTYKRLLVEDLLVNQHATGLNSSAFATDGDIASLTAIAQQTRSFYYVTLPAQSVAGDVAVSADEIQAYYDSNQAQFMSTEKVSIDYIELSLDQLAEQADVDPNEVQAQYQQELAAFEATTQRHVAHILIEFGDEAETKIAAVRERIAAGDPFADIAKALSDDVGSSEFGGDLGTTDGSTFPESFETALVTLEVGQVSDPVETDSGTHFIKLLAKQETQAPSFEESQAAIEEALSRASAENTFVELLDAIPDAAYNADSLASVADSLGLTANTSELFGRVGGPGILSNNQLLAAVFADDVLNEGVTSDIIEISDNHVVVLKVNEHHSAAVQPLEDVTADIQQRITKAKVTELLSARGAQLLAQLKDGQPLEALAEKESLEWQVKADVTRSEPSVDRELLGHIFTLAKPVDQQPVNTQISLANGDTVIAQLTVVKAGSLPDMEPAQKIAVKQRLGQEIGSSEFSVYQSALNDAASIDIY